jgi:hypothetical protein
VIKAREEMEKSLGNSIRQKLKDISIARNRPFEEILRYYGIERFLYRLSISSYAKKFFLKGGLMLKVWDGGLRGTEGTMITGLTAKFMNLCQGITK